MQSWLLPVGVAAIATVLIVLLTYYVALRANPGQRWLTPDVFLAIVGIFLVVAGFGLVRVQLRHAQSLAAASALIDQFERAAAECEREPESEFSVATNARPLIIKLTAGLIEGTPTHVAEDALEELSKLTGECHPVRDALDELMDRGIIEFPEDV
jgi:hypothetical protein